eukprot:Nitzschia sp. Nitz4//scaffold20_size174350//94011//95219//NITZ4_002107-RA/size174350-processed-gene-0.314-mRNA-1//-1//CDS//3329541824//6026//frame0
MKLNSFSVGLGPLALLGCLSVPTTAFVVVSPHVLSSFQQTIPPTEEAPIQQTRLFSTSDENSVENSDVLDWNQILPYSELRAHLQEAKKPVAGVFALFNSDYTPANSREFWDKCEHVGASKDVLTTLESLVKKYGSEPVSFVRVLKFDDPIPGAMLSIADTWKSHAFHFGGNIDLDPEKATEHMEIEGKSFGDDDDDDDDDFDGDVEYMSTTKEQMDMATGTVDLPGLPSENKVVSPFENSNTSKSPINKVKLPLTKENVDKVLDEVRPMLIADGGNVSVEHVDIKTRTIYVKLQGACGTCESSKQTMQLGVNRVLRDSFETLGQIVQVDDKESELVPFDKVAAELIRISPAITAMGGKMEIVSVDGNSGVVELKYEGPNSVRESLQLAIEDIDFVTEVKFT